MLSEVFILGMNFCNLPNFLLENFFFGKIGVFSVIFTKFYFSPIFENHKIGGRKNQSCPIFEGSLIFVFFKRHFTSLTFLFLSWGQLLVHFLLPGIADRHCSCRGHLVICF